MKKSVVLILGLLISSVFLSGLVLAQGMEGVVTSIGDIVKSIYNVGVEPLAKFMIGSESAGDAKNFFTLLIMLILLVSVLWEITERVPMIGSNSWVQFIVSFGIGLISVRFLGETANSAWFKTVLLPNQVLGVTLLCVIPLIIYFFFVMDIRAKSPTLAKILWVFGAVVFAALYFTRAGELGGPGSIYLITAIVCIALLLFDNTIGRWMHKIDVEKSQFLIKSRNVRELQTELRQIEEAYRYMGSEYNSLTSGRLKGEAAYKKDRRAIEKQILAISS